MDVGILAEHPGFPAPGDGKNGKDGKDGKGKGAICDANGKGKVDNELQKNQATDEQIEAIGDLLRSNKVDQALQLMQKDSVPTCFNLQGKFDSSNLLHMKHSFAALKCRVSWNMQQVQQIPSSWL